MAKSKAKKIKETNIQSEDSEMIRNFIITFGVVLVIVIAVYIISVLIVNKRDNDDATNETETAEVKIDYNLASVGMILNRPYDNYYVMVYDGNDAEAIYYASLITTYQSKEDAKKVFYTDLSEPGNSSFKSEKSNPKATSIDELAFGKVTLLEINKGKITKYIESVDEIKEILQ